MMKLSYTACQRLLIAGIFQDMKYPMEAIGLYLTEGAQKLTKQ